MPEPFDSRTYDPYSPELTRMTWLLGTLALVVAAWVTWPLWRQVITWIGVD